MKSFAAREYLCAILLLRFGPPARAFGETINDQKQLNNRDLEISIAHLMGVSDCHWFYSARRTLPDVYGELNDYLLNATSSNCFKLNFELGLDWLGRQAESATLYRNRYSEALGAWRHLDELAGACSLEGYKICASNWALANPVRRKGSYRTEGPMRNRVVSLVSGRIGSHLTHCLPRYRSMLQRKLGELNETARWDLMALGATRLRPSHRLEGKWHECLASGGAEPIEAPDLSAKLNLLAADHMLAGKGDAIYLRKIDDLKEGWRLNRKNFARVLRVHLVEPCEWFVTQLALDVLLPAISTLEFSGLVPNISCVESKEFLVQLSTYRACGNLILNKRKILEQMEIEAEKQSDEDLNLPKSTQTRSLTVEPINGDVFSACANGKQNNPADCSGNQIRESGKFTNRTAKFSKLIASKLE